MLFYKFETTQLAKKNSADKERTQTPKFGTFSPSNTSHDILRHIACLCIRREVYKRD